MQSAATVQRNWTYLASILLAATLLGGCASSTGNPDPFEGFNRAMYDLNDGLDRAVLRPATEVYEFFMPEPLRDGIHNGFRNLTYGNVILNDFLQGDVEGGFRSFARMAVNSTIGIGGLFDVATDWGLPAHENDFGITLGKWGAEPGPYLVLPLLGPSTGRDVLGVGTAVATNPLFWLSPGLEVSLPLGATRAVDARSKADAGFRFRDEAAIDPYIFTRSAYLQYRQNLIAGDQPVEDDEFYYEEIDFDDVKLDGADEVPE